MTYFIYFKKELQTHYFLHYISDVCILNQIFLT